MIFIKIEGADPYIATDFTRDIEDDLVKLYGNLPSEDLNFIIENSLFIHEGQDQTSFQVFVKVLSPKSYTKDSLRQIHHKHWIHHNTQI